MRGEVSQEFLDGLRTGDLTGRGAAHAVANDENSDIDKETEGVLVGVPLAAAIGKRPS
jgi:hypothetical protein